MKQRKFSLTREDPEMRALIEKTDQETLAIWAIDCARRVIPYFEDQYPDDPRPRRALETLQKWINTRVFRMSVIRKASLDAHAAARTAAGGSPARSAARACGQAVATAHVHRHAYGPAIYGQQAVFRAAEPAEAALAAARERDWQYSHLVELRKIQSLRPTRTRR